MKSIIVSDYNPNTIESSHGQQFMAPIQDVSIQIPDHLISDVESLLQDIPQMDERCEQTESIEDILGDLMELDEYYINTLASQLAADFDITQYIDVGTVSSDVVEPQAVAQLESVEPMHQVEVEPVTVVGDLSADKEITPEHDNQSRRTLNSSLVDEQCEQQRQHSIQSPQPENKVDESTNTSKEQHRSTDSFDVKLNQKHKRKDGVNNRRTKYRAMYKRRTVTDRVQKSESKTRKCTDGKQYTCKLCNKTFQHKFDLATHLIIHTGDLHSTSNSVRSLSKSPSRQSKTLAQSSTDPDVDGDKVDDEKSKRQCDVCQKLMVSKYQLRHHSSVHTGARPYQCGVCKKSFTRKSNLTVHSIIHTGTRPYQCAVCKKSFKLKYHLTSHSSVHTGARPFQCAVCKKSFTRTSYLKVHSGIHIGLKPFECDVCKKSFRLKCQLINHSVTHSGAKHSKPFSCDVCNASFESKAGLYYHSIVHSGKKGI